MRLRRFAKLQRTDADFVPTPLSKEYRQNQLASATKVVMAENDDEVLEAAIEIMEDLKHNSVLREGLKSYRKNGWAFIQKTPKCGIDFQRETTSSVLALNKSYQDLQSRGQLDREMHPMHNELILKKVFEFSSVKDLKNCRLVSTKWRDLSLTSWREKAVLRLSKVLNRDVEALIEDGSEFRKTPFKCLKLYYSPYYNGFGTKTRILDAFSSSIRYLHLSSDDIETIRLVLERLPELRTLVLRVSLQHILEEHNSRRFEDPGEESPQTNISKLQKLEIFVDVDIDFAPLGNVEWKRIFEKVPALKSLRVKYEHSVVFRDMMYMATLNDIMQSVIDVRQETNFTTLNLEEVDIIDTQHPLPRNPLDEDVATNIVESQFALRTLTIDLGIDTNPSTILKLLETHAKTLEYLKCYCVPDTKYLTKDALKLPLRPYLPSKVVLPSLKELVFVNGYIWAFHILGSLVLPSLEVLMIEPQKFVCGLGKDHELDLKKIVLKSESGYSLKTFAASSFLPNLKKFFYSGPRKFTATELRGLSEAMPSLTDLKIPLGRKTFPNIYKLWPGLESLHVLVSDRTYLLFDDHSITRLPVDIDCNVAGSLVDYRGPNITYLQNLRKFVLETTLLEDFPRPKRALITDLSAVYGFLQLPKLRVLQLQTNCKFSRTIMIALEKLVSEELTIETALEPFKGRDDTDTSDLETVTSGSSEDERESNSDSDGSN